MEERGPVPQGGRRTGWRAGNQAGTAPPRRSHPAVLSLHEALIAALQQRVAQQAARDHGARPPRVREETTPCSLPTSVTAPAQRNEHQGRHADCRG
jgi:hypothetical protein